MDINLDEYYEKKKSSLVYQSDFIEGIQYNFKLEDIQDMLNIKDINLFKKYLYYLDLYRVSYTYIKDYEDQIMKFISIISEEDEITKNYLLRIFLKHEDLFKNEKGIKRLSLVPEKYKNREFIRSFV